MATLIVPTQLITPDQPTVSPGTLDDGYAISWNAIANASDYRLQWRVQGTLPWSDVVDSTGGATSHTIIPTVAQQGTTYELQVQALGDGTYYADSAFSPEATLIVPAKLGTPDQPTSSGNLDDGYTVSWNAITNAADYRLQWRVQGTLPWTGQHDTGGATSHILALPPLSQGTTYELQVQALNSDIIHYVNSEFSPTATLIVPTKLATPNQPTVGAGDNAGGYPISWNAISNAAGLSTALAHPGQYGQSQQHCDHQHHLLHAHAHRRPAR